MSRSNPRRNRTASKKSRTGNSSLNQDLTECSLPR